MKVKVTQDQYIAVADHQKMRIAQQILEGIWNQDHLHSRVMADLDILIASVERDLDIEGEDNEAP